MRAHKTVSAIVAVGFALILAALGLPAQTASAQVPPPPGGDGCTSWVSNMAKSGTTIVGTFTVACDSTQSYITSSGTIFYASSGKPLKTGTDYCTACKRQNTVVKWKGDKAGLQNYGFIFESARTGVGVAAGGGPLLGCVELRCYYQLYRHKF